MNGDKLKSIIEKVSKETLEKDIVFDNGVLVNGNSKDKNDLVIFTSIEGYNELNKSCLNYE